MSKRASPVGILGLAALSTVGVHSASLGAVYTWDPAKTGGSGGNGTWDTTSPFWDIGTSTGPTATTWVNGQNATFAGTAGTVTVDPVNGIQLNNATFGVSGYTLSGGPITLIGSSPQFYSKAGTLTINSVLANTTGNGVSFASSGYSLGTVSLAGTANTYTGTTIISAVSVFINSIANGGTASPFGAGSGTAGYVQLGTSGSTIHLTINGTGGSTDRLYQLGGTGTSVEDIINASTGSVSFLNPGAAITGTASTHRLQLDGTLANAGTLTLGTNINNFGETLTDANAGAGSLTSVVVGSSTWALTGTNTFTGGASLSSGAQLIVNNSASLGTGSLTYTGNGTVSASNGVVLSNQISGLSSSVTSNFNNFTTTAAGVGGTFVISGLIVGTGNVRLATPSNSLNAPIEINNDSNSFSGLFSTANGFIQYTSVANQNSNSSLGTGANTPTISIGNGGSFVTFQYVGANVDSTNRPLSYTGYGTSGNLSLDSSGAGAVQYLANSPIRNGISTVANTNTIFFSGTSTGNNVLAQTINDNATYVANSSTTYVAGVTSVTKQNAGMWILTGSSTYTGPTTISGGNLTIDANDTAATLSGVTANASASIANSGSVTIAAAGTLHLLNSGAGSSVTMLSTNAIVSVVTGSKTLLDLNGQTQTISSFFVNGTPQDAGVYGSALYFADIGNPTLTTEQMNDEVYFGTTVAGNDGTNGAFSVTNSPEPSTLAIAGIGFVTLLRRRRSSSKVAG